MKNQQQIIAENKNDKKEAHLSCKDELKVRKIYMNNALLLNKWSERFFTNNTEITIGCLNFKIV